MSFKERLKSKMKITTGDGKVYEVLHKVESNTGSYEFNISEFEFPEVSGTKVDRRLPKGRRFPLQFFFQGDDNYEQFEAFRISANDLNPWTVLHPIFGQIISHPISIGFDNSGINTTQVDVTVVETITDDGPRTSNDARETALTSILTSTESNNAFMADEVQPEPADINLMQANATQLYNEGSTFIGDDEIAAEYFNLFTKAQNKINTAINDFNTGVQFITSFITFPAKFVIEIKERFKILKAQALKLSATLDSLDSPNKKKIFESQKGAVVSAAIESTLTPLTGDYQNAPDVLFVIDEMLEMYNTFIEELTSLQSSNGTELESYFPNAEFMFNLDFSVNYALSNLLQIALSAQQERVIYLEAPSNVIIQAHRFYGLVDDDETIQRFIGENKIQMTELLQIEKGRKLVYYV